MKASYKWIFLTVLALLLIACSSGDREIIRSDEPNDVNFITSDITNFWNAYDIAYSTEGVVNHVEVFEREYFGKASLGLKDFIEQKKMTASALVGAVNLYPRYYTSIRQNTMEVMSMQSQIRQSFFNLENLYDDAVFTNVYFLIGHLSAGGRISGNGILIGIEFFARSENTPIDELTPMASRGDATH